MLGGALVTHLYRLAKAHLVAEEYPSVPSLDGGGHSLALEREQRVLQGRCRRHLAVRESPRGRGKFLEGALSADVLINDQRTLSKRANRSEKERRKPRNTAIG